MDSEALIAMAASRLLSAGIENGRQEARWLAEYARNTPGDDVALLEKMLERRTAGEPLQYIMGTADFHCVELAVGPGVLIPRPETEQLVEIALQLYPGAGSICDVCTGSGAIPLAMAKQLPDTDFTAVDISPEALEYALLNKKLLGLNNVNFLQGNLFGPLPEGVRYAMITANPPYVSLEDYETLESTVKNYEPRLALAAEEDGLAVLRQIAEAAPGFLLPGGWLISEIGDEQGVRAENLLLSNGLRSVEVRKDYSGRDRFVLGQL